MPLRGKQRLALVGVVVAAVMLALVFAGSRASTGAKSSTGRQTSPSRAAGSPTAIPADIARLKSIGLLPGDLPEGTHLINATELSNNAAASYDPEKVKQVDATGRITGVVQQWRQDTAQFDFLNEIDLFNSAASATTRLMAKPQLDPSIHLQDEPDPKLGDASRMYGYSNPSPEGKLLQIYVVAWVRGRLLLLITAGGPLGGLQRDQPLQAAHALDNRVAALPTP
ncbi:MAG: hypothetical protein ACR2PL_18150 [Dehalococcoidia bacterium]